MSDSEATADPSVEEKGEEKTGEDVKNTEPSKSLEGKMDEDFTFFITYIPTTLSNIKNENQRKLCEAWLKRLTGKRSLTLAGKRNRNIYLLNLINQANEGVFQAPFITPPPQESLKPPSTYFSTGIIHQLPCNENLDISVEDFAEISKDRRTYFAAKALPNGRGAFAYVGVSAGGANTVWLNAAGDPICKKKMSKMREIQTKLPVKMQNLMKYRSPCFERNKLIPFYNNLLERVKNMKSSYGTDIEVEDTLIEMLIEDIQIEKLGLENIDSGTVGCYTKLHWLQALEEKLKESIRHTSEREAKFNSLLNGMPLNEGIEFLDLSESIKPTKVDTMIAEAARDRPSSNNIEILKRNYPCCIVQKLLKYLEMEKLNVIHQEQHVYQSFIIQLKAEVINNLKIGLERYVKARKEWHRVASVMKKLEEAKNRIHEEQEIQSVEEPGSLEDSLLSEELGRAKKQLEDAMERSEKMDIRLALLHEQLHQLTTEHAKMEAEGKRSNKQFAKEILFLQREIKEQEHKLILLRARVNDKDGSINKR